MAEQSAADRTEQPTSRRLSKAKSEGQFPASPELVNALALAALLLTLYMMSSYLLEWFTSQVREGLVCEHTMFANSASFTGFFKGKLTAALWIMLPLFLAITAGGLVANLVVSGFHVAPHGMKIKLDTLNPVSGLKQLFSSRSLLQLVLSFAKLIFIGLIVYVYLRDKLDFLAGMRWAWSAEFLAGIGGLAFGVLARVILCVLLIGVSDALYQKWKYIQELKMTKQEVKEERKQDEGSPQVKKKLRMVQFEMVRKRMMQKVPKANVVLVNPTHVAVALQYDSKNMGAPIVVAKGADVMAEKIKEVARAHGVPIIRRKELARTIFNTVEVDQPIPEGLYVAVAEILAMIHRLRKRRQ
jgi:flagellar biosynthesis protein FlhB